MDFKFRPDAQILRETVSIADQPWKDSFFYACLQMMWSTDKHMYAFHQLLANSGRGGEVEGLFEHVKDLMNVTVEGESIPELVIGLHIQSLEKLRRCASSFGSKVESRQTGLANKRLLNTLCLEARCGARSLFRSGKSKINK
tara:strand:+ start:39 stop:464 length:426 start_codon:yes stop_codon:yes gene_type:complete